MKVGEENGKSLGVLKGRARKFWRFSEAMNLEERWLSCFGSYLWSWGVKSLVEGRGTKYKFKENLETLN